MHCLDNATEVRRLVEGDALRLRPSGATWFHHNACAGSVGKELAYVLRKQFGSGKAIGEMMDSHAWGERLECGRVFGTEKERKGPGKVDVG